MTGSVGKLNLTDRGDESGVEGIFAEPKEDAGLAHSRVPDEEEFEEVIVRFSHFFLSFNNESGS